MQRRSLWQFDGALTMVQAPSVWDMGQTDRQTDGQTDRNISCRGAGNNNMPYDDVSFMEIVK